MTIGIFRMDGSITRIFDVITFQRLRYPNAAVMHFSSSNGKSVYGIEDLWDQAGRCAAWLKELGLQKGDTVWVEGSNASFSWFVLDFGCQLAGIIPVVIPDYLPPEEVIYITNNIKSSYFFYDSPNFWNELPDTIKNAAIAWVALNEPVVPGHWVLSRVLKDRTPVPDETLAEWSRHISGEDTAVILNTSGSTGHPKSVRLTHSNIISNIQAVLPLTPLERQHRVVSFLPIAHIFERMVVYCYLTCGASIYFFPSVKETFQALRQVKPHFFSCVPRILERMYDELLVSIQRFAWLRRLWLRMALETGKKYGTDIRKSPTYWIQWMLIDFTVFRVWRRRIGGNVKGIIVGAAALNPMIGRVFSAAGIRVREGYGMTETSPVISFNRFEAGGNLFGTAGIPIPGVSVRISDADAEGIGGIEVHGPNVMQGYIDPEANAAIFTSDGWLKTGDMGRFVHRRFLEITGRNAHAFKTSSGRFVIPDRIGREMEKDPLISRSIIVGFQRPYVTALIYPDFTHLQWWCEANRVHWTAPAYMIHNPKVIDQYEKLIESINQRLISHEQIRKFQLLPIPWQEEELYSRIGKVNPMLFFQKYTKEIDALYQNSSA